MLNWVASGTFADPDSDTNSGCHLSRLADAPGNTICLDFVLLFFTHACSALSIRGRARAAESLRDHISNDPVMCFY
ncbi:hypothetical protein Nepgr_004458 [Nepenthes gracilis]|uniref:Uncharacterized protein n=1 Tax=Nepenthes gracilis TaxID=150966 RepID=A0AAD3S1R9_NEPGR|nr:hypothetical protein Nepgr_004458 [Nepenthes gracilis]